ncbi:DNA double-strand break repair nuclease NurA, partial [Candidatus Bathyarchaeota archaeon]|nr:DNA double-strand break repair nuclease NurA [Candidatus Bathyarchaeota archaeon]
TPKYNFPHPAMDTLLPQRFTELSIHSLKDENTPLLQLNQQQIQQTTNPQQQTHNIKLGTHPISLKPAREPTAIAAVDTSNIKIGETAKGILIAVRAANVWKQDKHYQYARFGPFIFHVTEENKKQVYNMLQNAYFDQPYYDRHADYSNMAFIPMRIAALLERWLQTMVAKTLNNGLILFDGSLTSSTGDTPTRLMKDILDNARKRNNITLAFSKMTTLRINGHLITDTLPSYKAPYILEVTNLKPKPPMLLLGDIYVAKLANENYAFRLDIDREVSFEKKVNAVERLLGNDPVEQGYPETLRLAHILCTFTANEVIAMQHFATRRYGLKIVNRPDMHRLLFGPFGRGESFQ